MDESKLIKSDANRKPPREWRIYKLSKGPDREDIINGPDTGLPEIHVREVLPQDDSLRVSRDDIKLMRTAFENHDAPTLIGILDRIERESRGEG